MNRATRFMRKLVWALVLLPLVVSAEILRFEIPAPEISEEAEELAIARAFEQALKTLDAELEIDEALLEQMGDPQLYLSSYYDQQVDGETEAWVYVVEFERAPLAQKLGATAVAVGPDEMSDEQTAVEPGSALIWLVVEPLQESPFIAVSGASAELQQGVAEALLQSAMNWELPPQSVVGATGVDIAVVQNADHRTLRRVSEELGASEVFFGVLQETGPASWLSKLSKLGSVDADSFGDAATYQDSLLLTVEGLSSSAATSDGVGDLPITDGGPVMIGVSGLKGYAGFSKVTNFLGNSASVASWSPRGSGGGVTYFEVDLKQSHESFLSEMTGLPESILSQGSSDQGTQFKSVHYSFTLK